MKESKRELRMLPMTELRIADSDGGGATIEGHAAVFDSWSETLGGIFPFKEIVRKGAFNESIGKDDIRALFNHDPNYVLGRNRAGTLELVEDDIGLRVKITPPDTSWAKDILTSIRRGDITQMSIGFIVEDDKWSTKDNAVRRKKRKRRRKKQNSKPGSKACKPNSKIFNWRINKYDYEESSRNESQA